MPGDGVERPAVVSDSFVCKPKVRKEKKHTAPSPTAASPQSPRYTGPRANRSPAPAPPLKSC
jgi:hypothetical protein